MKLLYKLSEKKATKYYLIIGIKRPLRQQKELMSNRGCICNKKCPEDLLGRRFLCSTIQGKTKNEPWGKEPFLFQGLQPQKRSPAP